MDNKRDIPIYQDNLAIRSVGIFRTLIPAKKNILSVYALEQQRTEVLPSQMPPHALR